MKVLLLVFVVLSSLFGAKVVKLSEKYESAMKCKVCHKRIFNEWSSSWHAKSHFENDEYFRKSLQYVSRKTHRSLNAVKVECATCHNPRISVTKTGEDYEIASVMGLTKGSKVEKAVNDKAISEGINCLVCHNVDKIHDNYDRTKRGINRVEWTPNGVMTGPYADAKSPYHKVQTHEFMSTNPNKLCFVCHANDRSEYGLVFTDMQSEYKGSKKCVDCHMGKKHKDYASTYKMYNGKARERMVRNHGFKGGHFAAVWKNALALKLKRKGSKLLIEIYNPQPHNIPSGFGARELLVSVAFRRNNRIVKEEKRSLTRKYIRRHAKASTPHLAKKQSADMSIPAHGKRVLVVSIPKNANDVDVKVFYRLVNDEVRTLLDLKGTIWSKTMPVTSKSMRLKR
jgi:hypothetical protein